MQALPSCMHVTLLYQLLGQSRTILARMARHILTMEGTL